MTKRKNVYTAEFKADAVEMMKEHGVKKASEDLGVSRSTLEIWSKKANPENPSKVNSLNDNLKKIKRLEKENQYLKKINEVLKKSTAIFSQGELPPSK